MGKRRKNGPMFYNGDRPMRRGTFYKRPDKVKDPKTAFFYLLDNVASQNSGKYLQDGAARGEYFWVERNRSADQKYFIVRKRGNNVIVIERQWLVKGQGVNTFIGAFAGYEEEPQLVEKVVLKHPIMDVASFAKAYAEATPDLGHWINEEWYNEK